MIIGLLIILANYVTLNNQDLYNVPHIDPDCQAPSICANLYFYGAFDEVLHIAHGTNETMAVKNVVRVQNVGSCGCYVIYKDTNFGSESYCVEGMEKLFYRASVIK